MISVSDISVHLSTRRGLAQWHLTGNDMTHLRCMSFTGRGTDEIVVAGCQKQMYRIDLEKGVITEVVAPPILVPYTMMRRAGQCICAASHDGSIHLLDTRTLANMHIFKAYAGTVSDMDARGDYLLTCGWAPRHYHGLALEQLVRVYDVKLQKALPPISFPHGAACVRMHPKLSSTCMVISQTGTIYSIDVQNPEIPSVLYIPTYDAQLTGLELMPSGRGFALTDSHCHLILRGSSTSMQFVEYGKAIEFADAPSVSKHLDWSADTPLNLIGMPYYKEALLSVWSNSLVHEVGAPPPKTDPALQVALQQFQNGSLSGSVVSNPRKTRRNQIDDTRAALKTHASLAAPKFLSEKPREEQVQADAERRLSEDASKVLSTLSLNGGSQSDIPFWYRIVEIKYSKFGVDDFDFGYYNRTRYSGLETHIVNSYANPLLQLFRFTTVTRNLALHHTSRDCGFENCLLCELGFLIDMLEKAEGRQCQATNFLKNLSKHSSAAGLALLEEHTFNTPLSAMIQNMNRFLLGTIEENHRLIDGSSDLVRHAFGTVIRAIGTCSQCHIEAVQEKVAYSHDLVYPPKPSKHSPRNVRQYFSQVLKASVERQEQQRGWCSRCQGYKPILSRREIQAIPAVLMLNAAVRTADAKQLWSTPGFLPKQIGIIVNNGQFYCYEGQDLQMHLTRRAFNIIVYELVGVVADISAGDSSRSHLVSMINVGTADPEVSPEDHWHVFNDFLVRETTSEDALGFEQRWKLPSVITYQAKSMCRAVDDSWKSRIDTSILYRSTAQPGFSDSYEFRSYTMIDMLPNDSTHCAIDAEFVRLLREEIDIGADGSRTITRPAVPGLARVSVLRGDEPELGVPFIDDYISVIEPIDDYLTQYSGLKPGDLTLGVSKFVLVNLKAVYKKLWILLNLGCTFIGHGLSSDFRTINIHVPKSQIIDTQELFSLGSRARRKLSLRFLAWLLLNEDIQQNVAEGHDSIEDARTALKLWRKYLEYVDAGILEQMKDDIWIKGKAMDFRVPAERHGRLAVSETPTGSAPGTPVRRPVSVVRIGTPGRSEFGSPLR